MARDRYLAFDSDGLLMLDVSASRLSASAVKNMCFSMFPRDSLGSLQVIGPVTARQAADIDADKGRDLSARLRGGALDTEASTDRTDTITAKYPEIFNDDENRG